MVQKKTIVTNILIVFLGCILLHTGMAVNYNRKVEREFYPNGMNNQPYQRKEPVDTMDISRYQGNIIYSQIETLYPVMVRLKKPLRYYTRPDRNSPVAVELEAGKEYYLLWGGYVLGEGNRTLPTYKKGWRCATILRPVKTEGMDPQMLSKRFYVRLEDLISVQREYEWQYFLNHPTYVKWSFGAPFYTTGGDGNGKMEKIYYDLFTSVDSVMYRLGQYISPDLKKPLWDTWNTLFLTGAVLCLIAPPVCRKVKRRGEPATD